MSDVLRLEQAAFRAWPAETVVDIDGWRARSMQGVTRRANSAWVNECVGRMPLTERIEAVEAHYAAQRLPVLFQLSPVAVPCDLDSVLERRGYTIDAPVSIQVAPAHGLPGPDAAPAGTEIRLEAQPSPGFLRIVVEEGRFAECQSLFIGLLDRLAPRAVYGCLLVSGRAVAAGFLVMDGRWGGVFSMRTQPEQRGRGYANALLRALAQHAAKHGARDLYLQVERDNVAACSLYAKAGFQELYGYHYRRQPCSD